LEYTKSIPIFVLEIKIMQLSKAAIKAINDSNKIQGRIMGEFNRGQWTIYKWLKSEPERLATPQVVDILLSETALTRDQILEPAKELTE